MLMPFAFQGKIRVPGGQQAFRGVNGGNIDLAPVCPVVLGWIRFGERRMPSRNGALSSQLFQHTLKSLMDTLA